MSIASVLGAGSFMYNFQYLIVAVVVHINVQTVANGKKKKR